MKSFKGAAVLCLMMIVTIVSVFGSGQTVLKAYAEDAATAESCTYEESIDEFDDSFTEKEMIKEDVIEATDNDTSTTNDTVEIDFEEEPANEPEVTNESDDAVKDDDFIEQDIMYYGAFFYILNGIDSEIPEEIVPHPSSDYSDGIYIFDSIKTVTEIADTDLEQEPSDSGYFVDNEVTDNLKKMPSLEQIQAVRSDFDTSKHYIQCYVKKYVSFSIHIDGVIRTRKSIENTEEDDFGDIIDNSKKVEPKVDKPSEAASSATSSASVGEASEAASNASSAETKQEASTSASTEASIQEASTSASTAASTQEASTSASTAASTQEASASASTTASTQDKSPEEEPDITIEIEAICNNPVVPDDGQPHLVGDGFKIRIIDNKEPETLIEKIYDAFGEFLHDNVITVSAADGNGTTFKYKNHNFWVNIDAAYAYVTAKDISENGLKIPFWYGGQVVEPGEISVKVIDKMSGVTAALPSVSVDVKTSQPSYDVDNVITVEAGSTVKNDDGKTLTNDSYEIIEGSLKDGHEISKVVFNGSQTGAGESSNEITSVTIVDSEGKDVSSQYVIKLKKGKLILVENPEKTDPSIWSISAFDAAVTDSSIGTEETVGYNNLEWNSELNDRLTKNEITVITKERMSSVPGTNILGARLSATGDDSEYLFYRLALIMFSMILGISIIFNGIEIKNRKRVN